MPHSAAQQQLGTASVDPAITITITLPHSHQHRSPPPHLLHGIGYDAVRIYGERHHIETLGRCYTLQHVWVAILLHQNAVPSLQQQADQDLWGTMRKRGP